MYKPAKIKASNLIYFFNTIYILSKSFFFFVSLIRKANLTS